MSTTPVPISPAPSAITWKGLPGTQTLWQCGCLETTTPASLLRWCGQPDCLRLANAGVAYTQRQFDWQVSRGGTPQLVPALARIMVTPLPQVLPPPTGGQYFMLPLPGESPNPPSGTIGTLPSEPPPEEEGGETRKHPPQHPPSPKPGEKPGEKPPEKPGQQSQSKR